MELALLVYSISLLNGIFGFFLLLAVVAAATILCNWIYWIDGYGDERLPGCKSRSWKAFWVAVIACWIIILIPSEKTAYTMVGAYAAQKVAENPKVQEMSGKVLTIIEQKLDGYIEEGLAATEKKASKK